MQLGKAFHLMRWPEMIGKYQPLEKLCEQGRNHKTQYALQGMRFSEQEYGNHNRYCKHAIAKIGEVIKNKIERCGMKAVYKKADLKLGKSKLYHEPRYKKQHVWKIEPPV